MDQNRVNMLATWLRGNMGHPQDQLQQMSLQQGYSAEEFSAAWMLVSTGGAGMGMGSTVDGLAPGVNPCGLGWRILAQIIDSIILVVVMVGLVLATGDTLCETGSGSFNCGNGGSGIFWLISFLYYTLLEGTMGASLGKKMCGMTVMRADGSKAGIGWAALRNILRIEVSCCFLIPLILIGVTKKHQRLGDMAAGTVVVR